MRLHNAFRFTGLMLPTLIFAGVYTTSCSSTSGTAALSGKDSSKVSSKSVLDPAAIDRVKASLVRIKVVEPDYYDGREDKAVGTGSGTIIRPDGTILTNHHVAGKAVRIVCTMPNREEVPAILIGTDPATDIAIIRLQPEEPTVYPFVPFGDSDAVRVGDSVMALGSPVSLSQSVTLGIISNTEMIMPESFGDYTFTLDGENVGELVRWFGHDAAIYPGNSGGPLVNLKGEIIGVNEIGIGLGGAIPGNLAQSVAESIITTGKVRRAWMGIGLQPLLKGSKERRGVLINTVFPKSPAASAGVLPGDRLLSVNGRTIEGRFGEDLPMINNLLATLPIGTAAEVELLRGTESINLSITPEERQPVFVPERELRTWGITARNVTVWTNLDLARESRGGVVLSSYRSGGPAAKARPELREGDIILALNKEPINTLEDLERLTAAQLEGKTGLVPVVATIERDAEVILSVVEVGIDPLQDPGRDVQKGWLPMETQVFTSELAKQLGMETVQGVRVTRLYNDKPEGFPFKVGDLVTHVDGFPVEASRKEDAEVFPLLVRQLRAGREVPFTVLRDGEKQELTTTILRSPARAREAKRYRDLDFELIVREATFADREKPELTGVTFNVIADSVTAGGWAALAGLRTGDAILQIDGEAVSSVADVERLLEVSRQNKARSVIVFVRRSTQTLYLEIEPFWK